MKDALPDFFPFTPTLTSAQTYLLEEIEYCKAELQKEIRLLPTPPDNLSLKEFVDYRKGPEFFRLHKLNRDIDEITVKAIRSLFRRIPGKRGFPGISLKVIKNNESGRKDGYQILLVPGLGIKYHPKLPLWALQHFCEWIQDKRFLHSDDDYYLLADCKMGLETELQEPLDYDLLDRVLRARGFDMHSEKDLKKISKIDGINKSKRGRPKKRVRKTENSWEQIATQLGKVAKEGSIPTTGEGLKIMLQRMFPDLDFDKV